MKFLFNTKNSRMCLRREMQAPCPNINHMTAPLILWKERNLHLDPSIFCRKTNLQHLVNTSKKTSKKGSFNIQSLQLVPLSFLSKGRVIFLCVDYCRLNRLTIKNQYLLALILGLLDHLNHSKVYTKIDLHGAYNLVCIRKGDEWKMVFRTYYGHFEYVMMPFGLINVPTVFPTSNECCFS